MEISIQNSPMQLIRTYTYVIADKEVMCCDAREVHEYIGNGCKFADWIKYRIAQYGYLDGKHYARYRNLVATKRPLGQRGGSIRTDYHITVDVAEQLLKVGEVRRNPRTDKIDNTLYVLESKRMRAVKVGRTGSDIDKRLLSLRVGCPDVEVVEVFPNFGGIEASVHALLAKFCIGGEWFDVPPDHAVQVVRAQISSYSQRTPA